MSVHQEKKEELTLENTSSSLFTPRLRSDSFQVLELSAPSQRTFRTRGMLYNPRPSTQCLPKYTAQNFFA